MSTKPEIKPLERRLEDLILSLKVSRSEGKILTSISTAIYITELLLQVYNTKHTINE